MEASKIKKNKSTTDKNWNSYKDSYRNITWHITISDRSIIAILIFILLKGLGI